MSDKLPEKPKGVKVKQFDDQITIFLKWFDNTAFSFTGITVFWCLFSLLAFLDVFDELSDLLIFRKLFLLIVFLSISIFLLYSTIALWINQTSIFANDKVITVYHKPLPCPTRRSPTRRKIEPTFRVSKLERLYSQKLSPKREGRNVSENSIYEVRIKHVNGSDRKLVSVTDSKKALFIQKTLEDYLNLDDEPQDGELGRIN